MQPTSRRRLKVALVSLGCCLAFLAAAFLLRQSRPDIANAALASAAVASANDCAVRDLATLAACFAPSNKATRVHFEADVVCRSAEECCAGDKQAILQLTDRQNIEIVGNSHTFRRLAGQRACPAFQLRNSNGVSLKNLSFDEDAAAPPCELDVADCPSTIKISDARNIELDGVHVFSGKGYVVYVWHTDGFAFKNSSISDAGIIGLYIGHYQYGPSTNIRIENSIFAHSRTNGLALQGAGGDASPVLLRGNILSGNHWHGLWPVPNVPGGVTSGGQLLVADGHNIELVDNIIADAACENCNPSTQTVPAIEIADQAALPGGVYGLLIHNNALLGGAGLAIWQNIGTAVADLTISDNRLTGFSKLDVLARPAAGGGNVLQSIAKDVSPQRHRAVTLLQDGRLRLSSDGAPAPGAKVVAAFDFSAAPRPGAAATPIFLCRSDAEPVETASTSRACDGQGQASRILGYSYEKDGPNVRPLYACRGDGSAFYVSWASDCDGQTLVGALGFARDVSAANLAAPQ